MKSLKYTISTCLIFFMVFGLSKTTVAQDEARTEAIQLYNDAQELAGGNEFTGAIELYRDALQISRANNLTDITELIVERLPRVYQTRASNAYRDYQSQRTMQSLNRALDYFKASEQAAGEFNDTQVAQQAAGAIPQLYYIRSILHFRQDNLTNAMEDLDIAIEMNPNYAVAYYQKGIVQKQMTPNDVDAFMQWYDRAIEVAQNTNDTRTLNNARNGARDELIFRAVNLADERRFADAVALLNRVEEYDPNSYEANFRLAEIANLRGNWSNAETNARRALDLHTGGVADKAKIYFELGTALKGQGEFEAACSAFENARFGPFTGPANHELQFELKCEGHTQTGR